MMDMMEGSNSLLIQLMASPSPNRLVHSWRCMGDASHPRKGSEFHHPGLWIIRLAIHHQWISQLEVTGSRWGLSCDNAKGKRGALKHAGVRVARFHISVLLPC